MPHEYAALRDYWVPVRDYLSKQDVTQWQARPLRRCLAPKDYSGFRIVAQLDPLDHLLYTAAVFEIGSEIENERVKQSANCVYSWRFDPDVAGAKFFSTSTGHSDFLAECLRRAEQHEFVMELDIADFFPRIYFHRIENLFSRVAAGHQGILIRNLLRQWNQNVSYGLPIGQHASRLISEGVISDVDEALIANGANYTRFADDYRFFCKSERECSQWMLRIAELLHRVHGLTLQPSKTKIQRSGDFMASLRFFLDSSEQAEMEAKISQMVGAIEWEYGTVGFSDLDATHQALLLQLDLPKALSDHLADDRPRARYLQSLLLWLQRTADNRALESVIRPDQAEKLRPVVAAVAQYIAALSLDVRETKLVSKWLSYALFGTSLGDSEYGRA